MVFHCSYTDMYASYPNCQIYTLASDGSVSCYYSIPGAMDSCSSWSTPVSTGSEWQCLSRASNMNLCLSWYSDGDYYTCNSWLSYQSACYHWTWQSSSRTFVCTAYSSTGPVCDWTLSPYGDYSCTTNNNAYNCAGWHVQGPSGNQWPWLPFLADGPGYS
jgi:hypothetical protein